MTSNFVTALRHGVFFDSANEPRWALGVWRIFDPWVDARLQAQQGYRVPVTTRPLTIEFHFRRVVLRLVRSLAQLQKRIHEWDQWLAAGGLEGTHPELAFEIPEEGGIAADSAFHYLNLFIDDLARVIPYVLAYGETAMKDVEGFTELKTRLQKEKIAASPALRELFLELDCNDSWWYQGFKYGVGIRQRLTHYTDIVYFHGSAKLGDARLSGDISLTGVGGPIHHEDFEQALRELFGKLCEWLDRLEQPLLQHLSEKLGARGISWNPLDDRCRAVILPVLSGIRVDAAHYLYLPLSTASRDVSP
jgi:hypothetical protein